jgi:hypothetical protein
MKYKVYCEKPGGSYHPEYTWPFYDYETEDIDFAIEDYNCHKIVKLIDGQEIVVFDAYHGINNIKEELK